MKSIIIALLALGLCWLWNEHSHSYGKGWESGRRAAALEYEDRIGQIVDERVKGFRRVQGLREQSEYERGRQACQ